MRPTCSSFWLSSSLYTESAYRPLLSGVADLKPPSPLPLPADSLLLLGYALKDPPGGCAFRCDDEPLGCELKAYGELLLPCSVLYGAFLEVGRAGDAEAAEAGLDREVS